MSQSRALLGIAVSFAAGVVLLHASLLSAAEPKVARLGFVATGSPSNAAIGRDAFWSRLRALGWIDGQNLVVERRLVAQHDQLSAIVRHQQ